MHRQREKGIGREEIKRQFQYQLPNEYDIVRANSSTLRAASGTAETANTGR